MYLSSHLDHEFINERASSGSVCQPSFQSLFCTNKTVRDTLTSDIQNIRHVLITEDVVNGTAPPKYFQSNSAIGFWEEWAHAEHVYRGSSSAGGK